MLILALTIISLIRHWLWRSIVVWHVVLIILLLIRPIVSAWSPLIAHLITGATPSMASVCSTVLLSVECKCMPIRIPMLRCVSMFVPLTILYRTRLTYGNALLTVQQWVADTKTTYRWNVWQTAPMAHFRTHPYNAWVNALLQHTVTHSWTVVFQHAQATTSETLQQECVFRYAHMGILVIYLT